MCYYISEREPLLVSVLSLYSIMEREPSSFLCSTSFNGSAFILFSFPSPFLPLSTFFHPYYSSCCSFKSWLHPKSFPFRSLDLLENRSDKLENMRREHFSFNCIICFLFHPSSFPMLSSFFLFLGKLFVQIDRLSWVSKLHQTLPRNKKGPGGTSLHLPLFLLLSFFFSEDSSHYSSNKMA